MSRTELLQKLKARRKELADREGIELFMVFTNKALEETVKAMPATLEDLALVKGWGKTKIAKYGGEILDVISGMSEVGLLTSNVRSPTSDSDIGKAIFSVSEFLEVANITLARLGTMRVRGEVSEMRHRGTVVYFTLKDTGSGDASVKCVLWAWKYEREYSYLEDGMEVVVDASPEVYAKYGSFDMRVERVEPIGEGALQKAFETLKKKLEQKGYFDAMRKRPLPAIIQRIGVITSEKGEAINDFLKNIGAYGFEIILMDVRVEGERAQESIVHALQRINALRPDLDVLCLIRGGGGLENLKAYNAERVADAVVSSRIPVLTGIGHERDQTMAGLSSDADFSTPTKVADAIRRGREELLRGLDGEADELRDRTKEILEEIMQVATLLASEIQKAPEQVLERIRVRISGNTHKLETALGRVFAAFHILEKKITTSIYDAIRRAQALIHILSLRRGKIQEHMQRTLQISDQRIAVAVASLTPLNPEAPLQRGYSIVYGASGRVVKHAEDVMIGERVTLQLYRGSVKSRVEERYNER